MYTSTTVACVKHMIIFVCITHICVNIKACHERNSSKYIYICIYIYIYIYINVWAYVTTNLIKSLYIYIHIDTHILKALELAFQLVTVCCDITAASMSMMGILRGIISK